MIRKGLLICVLAFIPHISFSQNMGIIKFITSCLLQYVFVTLQLFIPRKWFQNHYIATTPLYKMVFESLSGDKYFQSCTHIL